MISLATVTHVEFEAVVGAPFVVSTPDKPATLDLAGVRVLGGRRAGAVRDPFSLGFRGAPGLRLPQGVYAIQNATLGSMEIFITQTGDGAGGSDFEAIFT